MLYDISHFFDTLLTWRHGHNQAEIFLICDFEMTLTTRIFCS
jgi:hypothetical protein